MIEQRWKKNTNTFTPTRYVLPNFSASLMSLMPTADPHISMVTQSLPPATGKFFEMYGSLVAYFTSQPNCPTLILNTFQNEVIKFWLLFLHHLLDNCTNAICHMERQFTSNFEVLTNWQKEKEDERGCKVDIFLILYLSFNRVIVLLPTSHHSVFKECPGFSLEVWSAKWFITNLAGYAELCFWCIQDVTTCSKQYLDWIRLPFLTSTVVGVVLNENSKYMWDERLFYFFPSKYRCCTFCLFLPYYVSSSLYMRSRKILKWPYYEWYMNVPRAVFGPWAVICSLLPYIKWSYFPWQKLSWPTC
jgi:hypothetical protein